MHNLVLKLRIFITIFVRVNLQDVEIWIPKITPFYRSWQIQFIQYIISLSLSVIRDFDQTSVADFLLV